MVNNTNTVIIDRHELRALLHWAAFGISNIEGGAYQEDVEGIIEYWTRYIHFPISPKPKFKNRRELANNRPRRIG